MQTAETKRIECPSGRLTIRNTMIKLEVHGMSKYIFDYDDGDFTMSISDSMAMDSDGDLMMRMGRSHGNGYGHRRYSHDLLVV